MQSLFQFTPLREGRRPLSSRGFINIYFNSRPSARGDETGIHMRDCARISIHAPPRGATIAWVNGGFSGLISIHAPPRGATSKVSGAVRQGIYFNSRPSARGDCRLLSVLVASRISIHAPPRGATLRGAGRVIQFQNFNSRPSARGDDAGLCFGVTLLISIHAPPRGATIRDPRFYRSAYFNSRPSARGDKI